MISLNGRLNRNIRNHAYLGGGIHSQVYKSRMGYATKVCQNADPWPEYVEWAAGLGYAGNLAPMVYSIRPIVGGYVATMELCKQTLATASGDLCQVAHLFEKYAYSGYPLDHKDLALLHKYLPGFEAFVASFRLRFGNNWDLGTRNMMLRFDGSICITDPIGGRSGSVKSWRNPSGTRSGTQRQ